MTVYIPPDRKTDFKNLFLDGIESLANEEIIVVGDMNINWNASETKTWKNSISRYGFKQVINDNTRVSSNSATLLDHIYTNRDQHLSGSGVLPINISDHYMTYYGLSLIHI